MASTRISEQLPPHFDPTQAPVAFGNRALPRLSLELQDPQLCIRQRALAALCDLVHDPKRAYEAIHKGKMHIPIIALYKILAFLNKTFVESHF